MSKHVGRIAGARSTVLLGGALSSIRCGRLAWEYLTSTEELRGRVASTFRDGVNVLLGTDVLICFHSPGAPLGPWGVEASLDWKQLDVNDRVTTRAGDVRVGLLSLSLDRAEVHGLRLSAVGGPIDLQSLADRAKALKDLQDHWSDGEPTRSPDRFRATCQRILDAWVSHGTVDGLSQLIGNRTHAGRRRYPRGAPGWTGDSRANHRSSAFRVEWASRHPQQARKPHWRESTRENDAPVRTDAPLRRGRSFL